MADIKERKQIYNITKICFSKCKEKRTKQINSKNSNKSKKYYKRGNIF